MSAYNPRCNVFLDCISSFSPKDSMFALVSWRNLMAFAIYVLSTSKHFPKSPLHLESGLSYPTVRCCWKYPDNGHLVFHINSCSQTPVPFRTGLYKFSNFQLRTIKLFWRSYWSSWPWCWLIAVFSYMCSSFVWMLSLLCQSVPSYMHQIFLIYRWYCTDMWKFPPPPELLHQVWLD